MNAASPVSSRRSRSRNRCRGVLVGLDGAVHHRGCCAQAGAVSVAHDVEPLVGGRLAAAVQQLADPVHQDFGSAAWMLSRPAAIRRAMTVGTGSCESRDRWITSGGDSACSLNVGYRSFTARRDLIPGQGQVGLCPPWSSNRRRQRRSSRRSCETTCQAQHAPSGDPRAGERAVALGDADVRVVDVTVDDVGDEASGCLRARIVSAKRLQRCRRVSIQPCAGGRHLSAALDVHRNAIDTHR